MEKSLEIARLILRAAKERNFLRAGELAQIPALAESEKLLFLRMFDEVRKFQEREGREELEAGEIVSMFTFVCARAAEAVLAYVNGQKFEAEMMGLFDGKIPFYLDDRLGVWLRALDWPGEAASAFLRAELGVATPILMLFEALKWTWRVTQHLVIEELEARGVALR